MIQQFQPKEIIEEYESTVSQKSLEKLHNDLGAGPSSFHRKNM